MELTGKGNDILDKAEDIILRGVEKLLDTPEKLTTEDCRNLQTLVCTAGRIQAIWRGSFHSNYPDGQKEAAPTPEAKERQGDINPDRLRKSEILSLARLFHVSIGTATGYRDILAAQVKQSGVELK